MLKLSSPWMNYYKAMKAFFDKDPDVRVVFDEQTNEINVYVEVQQPTTKIVGL